jgi:hypothetical protein
MTEMQKAFRVSRSPFRVDRFSLHVWVLNTKNCKRGTQNAERSSAASELSRFQSADVTLDLFAVFVVKTKELDSKALALTLTRITHP